jgi:hypothetical protein
MAVRKITLPLVTASGIDGAAEGTETSDSVISGKLLGVYIQYGASSHADTDVVITTKSPVQTLLSVSNSNTSAFHPVRVAAEDNAGATVTYDGTNEIYVEYPLDDYVTVTVDDQNNTRTVQVYLWIEV